MSRGPCTVSRCLRAQIALQHGAQLGKQNAPPAQLRAVAVLRQVGLTSEYAGTRAYRLIEGLMLEGMERVVMNEDADRTLGGQQVCGMMNPFRKPMQVRRQFLTRGCVDRMNLPAHDGFRP